MMGYIRLAVIDDQEPILNEIKGFINNFPNVDMILSTTDASELFSSIDQGLIIDVILLDINMPVYNGFDIAHYLKESHPQIKIIFMSAYQDFALQGYKYYPEDFLTKPINIVRLKQTLDRLSYTHKKARRIGIKTNGKIFLVDTSSILYIEKKGRKTFIHLKDAETVECSEGLNKLEDILNQCNFYRTHQSYLVSIDKIEYIESDNYMKSYNVKLHHCNHKITLSRHKFTALKNLIERHF
ncbi:two-component system LytT family response regulator [Peribacillus simplex]|uniref:LytR/AlgR family response regulator transcription factor n=1 Tax=Peribacillus TaxID=2675229 RepID=UPI0024E1BE4E|nr:MULTISPECIES: LytTR family DNA-binding domain-containing protein [Peribacillus]MDF9761634.1 two-component system LytT family response regulator [Peribacillus simplex]MDV7767421.1 LytTR family DNA-binding domain-containing protein [Peribacillus sp. CSMR9]